MDNGSNRPSQIAHFRVRIGKVEVALHSVSALHDLIPGEADPDIRMAITLRRAIGHDRLLFDWYRQTTQGAQAAVQVSLALLDSADGKVVNQFGLKNARPVRWTGPHFDAQVSAVAMEELELRYDAVHWIDP